MWMGQEAGGGSATTEVTTVSHQEGGLAQTPRQHAGAAFFAKTTRQGRFFVKKGQGCFCHKYDNKRPFVTKVTRQGGF